MKFSFFVPKCELNHIYILRNVSHALRSTLIYPPKPLQSVTWKKCPIYLEFRTHKTQFFSLGVHRRESLIFSWPSIFLTRLLKINHRANWTNQSNCRRWHWCNAKKTRIFHFDFLCRIFRQCHQIVQRQKFSKPKTNDPLIFNQRMTEANQCIWRSGTIIKTRKIFFPTFCKIFRTNSDESSPKLFCQKRKDLIDVASLIK